MPSRPARTTSTPPRLSATVWAASPSIFARHVLTTIARHEGAACRWFVDPVRALPHARSGAVAVVDGRVLDAGSSPAWIALLRAWDPARLVWIAGPWDREARDLVRRRGGQVLRSHLDPRRLRYAILAVATAPGPAWIHRAAPAEAAARPAGGAR